MNPILIEIGNFSISWYSIFILTGVLIAGALFLFECKKYQINTQYGTNLIFWTVIYGIIGARLYYVLFNWDYYSANLNDIYMIWKGGLAIHGGIIAGIIFMVIYALRYKVRVFKILDMAAVGVIIAQAIGRWGNFFNSEAHGAVTTRTALESIKIIPKFVIDGMNIGGSYYIPTFYYESLWCILGFILLMLIRKFYKYLKVGQLTSIYLIWYGIGRFFIEATRTDSLMLGNLKAAQIVSILMIVVGIIILIVKSIGSKFDNRYDSYEVEDVRF